jgi:alcohol dehydrogenase (cytochrome c)
MINQRIPALLLAAFAAMQPLWPQVASQDAANWLTYSGNVAGWQYSALDQINTSNVGNLAPQWVFQTGDLGKFETMPLVVNGVMYATGQNNRAFALDARTGKAIWRYARALPPDLRAC